MPFSRTWLIVLAILVAVGLALAALTPRPLARKLAQARAHLVDEVNQSAEVLLKLEAREWVNLTAELALAPQLAEVIEGAPAAGADRSGLEARCASRLLALVGAIDRERAPTAAIVVDVHGQRLCGTGPPEGVLPVGAEKIIGYPIVQQALRGFALDNSWSLNGKLLRVAGAPIIARERGRYLGALLLARQVDKATATRMKGSLGGEAVEVAFFLRGELVASTAALPLLKKLPYHYSRIREQQRKKGIATTSRPATYQNETYTAVMTPLAGGAADHNAFYAIIGPPMEVPVGLGALLAGLEWNADARGIPWLLCLGLVLILVVCGLMILGRETSRPLRAFLRGLRAIHRGESPRMEARRFAGLLTHMARAVNDLIDQRPRAKGPSERRPSSEAPAGMGFSGGAGAQAQAAGYGLDLGSNQKGMPRLAGDSHPLPPLGAEIELQNDESARAPRRAPEQPSGAGMGPSAAPLSSTAQPPARVTRHSRETRPALAPAEDELLRSLPPVSLPDDLRQEQSAPAPLGVPPREPPRVTMQAPNEPSAPISIGLGAVPTPSGFQAPSAGAPAPPGAPDPDKTPMPAALPNRGGTGTIRTDAEPTRPQGAATSPDLSASDELDTYLRKVFDQFVAAKERCGESLTGLDYERFVEKLKKNRTTLMGRFSCRDVRFKVYVKDGKAALKATPVTD